MREYLAKLAFEYLCQDKTEFIKWRVKQFAQTFLNGVPLRSPYGPRMVSRFEDGTWMITMRGLRDIESHLSGLNDGGVFLDVGANDGSYSLAASKKVGSNGLVLAFEPNPWIFANLVRNIELNGCHNVIAMNIAIGSKPGAATFSHKVGHTGSGRVGDDAGQVSWTSIVESISSTSGIAEFCKERSVFCKIDVEGAEYDALLGLQGIFRDVPCERLVVEIDAEHMARYGRPVSEFLALAESFGLVPTSKVDAAHYDEVFVNSRAVGKATLTFPSPV